MDTFSSKKQIGGAGLASVSASCDPMDCRPPGSSVHGIFLARILEWVAISFSNMWNLKKNNTKELIKQKQTHRQEAYGYQMTKGGGKLGVWN